MGIIISLLLGCLAGFCAGKLMKGGGFGLIMNCVLGLFGGALGGWLFDMLGIEWGPPWSAWYCHHRCRCYPLDCFVLQEIKLL